MSIDLKNIFKEVQNIHPGIISHRRKIHENPELSFEEHKTSEYIESVLDDLGIGHKRIAGTGVVGLIGAGGKCAALRADIDALPIDEETGLPYASKNPGVMHACGHDMHTSMLLAAAEILKKHEKDLGGTVKLIFQPGEEKIPGGAKIMIEAGVLEDPHVDVVFGQHINPAVSTGEVLISSGYVMASADELYWTIRGTGTHAAMPHLGNDVLLSGAEIIKHMQELVSKFRDPLQPGVISVTSMHGGSANNIMPEKLEMLGTVRSFNEDWREMILETIAVNSKRICDMYGTECDFYIKKGYPAVINDVIASEIGLNAAVEMFGNDSVKPYIPKMWAEDFAYFTLARPAAFFNVGVLPPDLDIMPTLHNPKLNPDENGMVYGASLLAGSAVKFLNG